jgi:hypothetical protein
MQPSTAMSVWLPVIDDSVDAFDPKLRRDLQTLVKFVQVYCDCHHGDDSRSAVVLRSHNVECLTGHAVKLCPDCGKLLAHALVKRSHCPMNPKPACKHCPRHCYHPRYRRMIAEVMRFSGKRLVLSGRVDYLLHLLF